MAITTDSNSHILVSDPHLQSRVEDNWFDPKHWRQQDALTGGAAGRGTTHFFRHDGQDYVLRHYRRGGMVGKLIKDQYLYLGLINTRAWQEIHLLEKMQEWGLLVPHPVAARVKRQGVHYTADIITRRIEHASDAHQLLSKGPLPDDTWQAIGRAIAALHKAQVYHHDLNIHNIMLDDQQRVWLIDFDKCAQRDGEQWKDGNLQRLLRSLHKEQGKFDGYHFDSTRWQLLLSGYQSADN